jgi:hypothetical protein
MSSGGPSSLPPTATISGQASGSNNNNNSNNDNSNGNARYCGPRNRHGGCGTNNNNNNNNNSTTRGPFKGKATNLHGFIYDISNNDLFSKTTKEIAEHVPCTIEGAGDFRLAMVDLAFPTLTLPSAPVDAPGTNEPSWVDKEQYMLQYSAYIKKMDKRSQVQAKVFPLVLRQCSLIPYVTAWRQVQIGTPSTPALMC